MKDDLGLSALVRTAHEDGRWECMDFDSEDGHRCAHCGARYRRDGVDHNENCPHELQS